MNCDRAGELLGTYLRDELTASTRAEVQTHLDHCADCRADLNTYRLVFELPRIEPSATLHDRIFSSPEFQEIAHTVNLHQRDTGESFSANRASADRPAPVSDRVSANGAYSHLKILRPDVPATRSVSNGNGHHGAPHVAEQNIRRIDWQRAALRLAVAAAVLVLILGSALAVKNLLQTQPTTTQTPNFVLSGPVPGPLAAGNRVVYLHNGRLWSAPENGPQIRSPLTSAQVTAAPGWAVAPAGDSAGVHHLAYIDLKTGTLHIIQTDDRGDLTVGSVAPSGANAAFWQSAEGQAILGGLAWAPDARQLAFVADRNGSGAALWVANADGSASRPVSGAPTSGAWPLLPAWASDGSNLAYALAQNGATSLWDYAFDGNQNYLLEQRASPQGDASDVVRGLFWTTDTLNPTLTWSAGTPDGKVITGLWSYRLNQTPHLVHLTPAGATFSAVDYSQQAGSTGSWLVGQVGVGLRSIHADGSKEIGLAAGRMAAVRWSPDGSSALYLVADPGAQTGTLWTWTPLLGQRQIAGNVALTPMSAWSPDAEHLLYVQNGQTFNATADGNSEPLSGMGTATALSWSPDGGRVAIADAKGLLVSNPDGSAATQVDNIGGVSGLVWTAVP